MINMYIIHDISTHSTLIQRFSYLWRYVYINIYWDFIWILFGFYWDFLTCLVDSQFVKISCWITISGLKIQQ